MAAASARADLSRTLPEVLGFTRSSQMGQIDRVNADAWRKELPRDFELALTETKLPERPDCEAATRFLVIARREMAHCE